MTCDQFDQLVDDFLEHRLDAATTAEVEDHLSACPACRTQADELRALHLAATSLPRDIQPAHNLWPGISARLAPRRSPAFRARRRVPLAMAATALVAVTALFTARMMHRGPAVAAGPAPAALRPAAFDADRDYALATEDLERLLAERRSELAPATVAVLERNLSLIDAAIAESRAALAADPSNADLRALLWGAHRQKLELLERATRLTRS